MNDNIKSLFIRYLEKTISDVDEKILMEWLKTNRKYSPEFSELKKTWALSDAAKFDEQYIEKEWSILLQKVLSSRKAKHSNGMIMYWLPRVAAVFMLGAIMSFAVAYSIFNKQNSELVYQEVKTPAGAKSQVILPDGTNVFLNAGSSIKYANNYGKNKRDIFLTGEAYFDVVSNKSKIFVVHTSELEIKAYGTSFNVKAYPGETTTETTLIKGSIGVTRKKFDNKKTDEVRLKPNQRVVYYRKAGNISKPAAKQTGKNINTERKKQKLTYMISKGIDPKPFTSWKNGVLFINSETLKELAVKLERKYDVKIHFENHDIENLKFTGSLENETIEQVIDAISIAANIDYRIKDRDVWLKNKNKH